MNEFALAFAAFGCAAVCARLIVALGLGAARADRDEPQHVHERAVPRIGGVAVLAGCLAGLLLAALLGAPLELTLTIVAITSPAFAAGLAEDLTGRTGVTIRYCATFAVGLLALLVLDARVPRLDVQLFDAWLLFPMVSVLFTLVCVAGVSQSFNIIDGLNGLAGGTALIALLGMAAASHLAGDAPLAVFGLIAGGAVAGFLLLNYPHGRLFLGDGGAYFTGGLVALMAVLMVQRHPQISAWFPLLLVAYPVLETLLSLLRRLVYEAQPFHQPDRYHLHSLLHQRLGEFLNGSSNPLAAGLIVGGSVVTAVIAFVWRHDAGMLQLVAMVDVPLYVGGYALLRRRAAGRLASAL